MLSKILDPSSPKMFLYETVNDRPTLPSESIYPHQIALMIVQITFETASTDSIKGWKTVLEELLVRVAVVPVVCDLPAALSIITPLRLVLDPFDL